MGGKRIHNWRQGDRSEYLAQYLLSRFSYVCNFERQEDFGVVDYLCILTRRIGASVFPENGFYLQVKSNRRKITYSKDATNWISNHLDLPLFVGVINKKNSSLTIYSCSRIWYKLFVKHKPEGLILNLTTQSSNDNSVLNDNNGVFEISLGPPIFSKNIDEIESDPDSCYHIMKPWIELDKQNIARRSVGRLCCASFTQWGPNILPEPIQYRSYTHGPQFKVAESDIAPILTALCHSYRRYGEHERFDSLISYMKNFPEFLDEHGRNFIDHIFFTIENNTV